MRKALLTALVAVVSTLLTAAPAAAHNEGPCNDSGEPGNSDYAAHHIVPLASARGLGADGHVPGSHMGYSLCLDVHG